MIQINPAGLEISIQIPFKVWFPNKHIYKHCRFQKLTYFYPFITYIAYMEFREWYFVSKIVLTYFKKKMF